MRDKKEVQAEIDWREEAIKELRADLKRNSILEEDREYIQSRIINLSFAIEWCKWFLNE